MIIAIDGYEANVANRVGIGRYAYEILRHIYDEIRNRKSKLSDVIFRIYLPSKPLSDMPEETFWWQYRVVKPSKLWTFIGLPLALLMDQPRADVVFSPTHYVPRYTGIPRVMSIMDVSYLEFPQLFRAQDLHKLVYWTRYSVRHAEAILTISEFSKNAIMKAYGMPEGKVVVTYLGMTTISNIKNQKSKIQSKYQIGENYILSVGTIQPRKNYSRLIEAFSLLERKDLRLVIVGKKGWLYEEILKAPREFGVEDRVKFLEFVPDADLPGLYANAACFALPSLYEGFGLPVLEAMVHKCPVVVSNVSSLPEIAGSAGIYVNPNEVGSIVQGLATALKESKAQREARITAGLRQAEKFSWEKAASQTLAILEQVAKQ